MQELTIFQRLGKLLHDEFYAEYDSITEESNLKESFDFDSVDHVELLIDLEKEFQLNITEEEADKWQTIGDIVRYLNNRINKNV